MEKSPPITEETKTTEPGKCKYDKYEDDDIAQCPVLKDKLDSFTPDQLKEMRQKYDEIVKPMMKKKKNEEEKKESKPTVKEEKKSKTKTRHPRFEKYRESQGACPYMNTSRLF